MLEDIELTIKTEKEMKKSDLKNGMWIEVRNGAKCLFIKGCETKNYGTNDLFIGHNVFMTLSDYNNNLKSDGCPEWDVVKVYWDVANKVNARTLRFDDIPLFWERTEPIELTISEIETKLGLEKGTLKIASNEKE